MQNFNYYDFYTPQGYHIEASSGRAVLSFLLNSVNAVPPESPLIHSLCTPRDTKHAIGAYIIEDTVVHSKQAVGRKFRTKPFHEIKFPVDTSLERVGGSTGNNIQEYGP